MLRKIAHIGAQEIVLRHEIKDDFSLFRPASVTERVFAFGLDLVLSAPLFHLGETLLVPIRNQLPLAVVDVNSFWLGAVLVLLILTLYWVLPTWQGGRTLGKQIVGIRVIASQENQKLTVVQIVLREIFGRCLWLATLPLYGLSLLLNKPFPIHDFISHTRVVALRADLDLKM